MTPLVAEIVDFTSEGLGVGKVDHFTYFIEGTVIGDTVSFLPTKRKKNFGYGRVLEILSSSSQRVEAPCPYQKDCGGCPLMTYDYQAENAYKAEKIRMSFQKFAQEEMNLPKMVSAQPLAYRNKLTLKVTEDGSLAYYNAGTHQPVRIHQCLLGRPILQELFSQIQSLLKGMKEAPKIKEVILRSTPDGKTMTIFRALQDTPSLKKLLGEKVPSDSVYLQRVRPYRGGYQTLEEIHLRGEKTLTRTLGGLSFEMQPQSFFQVNDELIQDLYQKAISYFPAGEKILDLYCGTGTTSLLLAKKAGQVIGIESHPKAVQDARENARKNDMTNVSFQKGRAEDLLPRTDLQGIHYALVDPPRAGLHERVVQAIGASPIQNLIYISCNPDTLARDVGRLKKHGFQLVEVTGFNQFARTAHVECVTLLSRKKHS